MCPNCLGQSDTLSATLRLIGLFLLVPPAIFFAVARAIRRLERGDQRSLAAAPPSAPGGGGGSHAG